MNQFASLDWESPQKLGVDGDVGGCSKTQCKIWPPHRSPRCTPHSKSSCKRDVDDKSLVNCRTNCKRFMSACRTVEIVRWWRRTCRRWLELTICGNKSTMCLPYIKLALFSLPSFSSSSLSPSRNPVAVFVENPAKRNSVANWLTLNF